MSKKSSSTNSKDTKSSKSNTFDFINLTSEEYTNYDLTLGDSKLKLLIITAFDKIQYNLIDTINHISILNKEYTNNKIKFSNVFITCVNVLLVQSKTNNNIERCIEFISQFIEDKNNNELAIELLKHLLYLSKSTEKSVRFRSVQLIAKIFKKLSDDAEVPEDLFNLISSSLLLRVNDKLANIRVQAVYALKRIQDEDNILLVLLDSSKNDPSKEVRAAIIQSLDFRNNTREAIVSRTSDISSDVRTAAYTSISSVPLKYLKGDERFAVLKGLTDRDDNVKRSAEKVVMKWIQKVNNNVLELLKSLNVEANFEELDILMNYFFTSMDISTLPQPPFVDLTNENTFYWQKIVQFAKSNPKVVRSLDTEAWFGDTVQFCDLINRNDPFICSRLLELTVNLDRQDEIGMRSLNSVLVSYLHDPEFPLQCVPSLMTAMLAFYTDSTDFSRFMLEILHDLHDPMEESDEIRSVREELEEEAEELTIKRKELVAEKNAALAAEDFEAAADIKKKMVELLTLLHANEAKLLALPQQVQNENTTLLLLSLLSELLQYSKTSAIHDHLLQFPELAINNENPKIKFMGVKTMALWALGGEKYAKEKIPLLFQPLLDENGSETETQHVAIQGIFDLLLMYGSDLCDNEMINFLADCMSCEDIDIRNGSAIGFAKLFLSKKVTDESILSKLVVLFFHPDTQEDAYLLQYMTVFFACFIESSRDLWKKAFIPTVLLCLEANKDDPLSKVDAVYMAHVMISMGQEKTKGKNMGEELLSDVLDMMVNDYKSCDIDSWSQIISFFDVPSEKLDILQNCLSKITTLSVMIRDKNILKNISKTVERIKAVYDCDKPSVSVDNANYDSDIDKNVVTKVKPIKPATANKATPKKKKLGVGSKKQKWSESEEEDSDDASSEDEENEFVEYAKPLVEKVIIKRNPLKTIDNLLNSKEESTAKSTKAVTKKAVKPTLVQNIQDIDELLDN